MSICNKLLFLTLMSMAFIFIAYILLTQSRVARMTRAVEGIGGSVDIAYTGIYLNDSAIDDRALIGILPDLADCTISSVSLKESAVGDAGLCQLVCLCRGELTALGVSGTKATPAGLVCLLLCANLEHVSVSEELLSSDGLKILAQVDSLKQVHVHGQDEDTPRAKQIRAKLPGVRVSFHSVQQ